MAYFEGNGIDDNVITLADGDLAPRWKEEAAPTVTAEDVLHYHRLIPVGMKPILKERADKGDQRAAKLLSIVQGEPGI